MVNIDPHITSPSFFSSIDYYRQLAYDKCHAGSTDIFNQAGYYLLGFSSNIIQMTLSPVTLVADVCFGFYEMYAAYQQNYSSDVIKKIAFHKIIGSPIQHIAFITTLLVFPALSVCAGFYYSSDMISSPNSLELTLTGTAMGV